MEKGHSKPRMLKEVSHFFLSSHYRIPGSCKKIAKTSGLKASTVGVIIVDAHRIMRFANPAAQQMLGLKDEEYLGQLFNFFMAVNEVSEISIVRENRKSGIASMQIGEIEWKNEHVYLAVLRDVTGNWRREKDLNLC